MEICLIKFSNRFSTKPKKLKSWQHCTSTHQTATQTVLSLNHRKKTQLRNTVLSRANSSKCHEFSEEQIYWNNSAL